MPTKISPVGSSASGGGSIGPTTPTNFTEGSVIFAGASELSQNNAAFKWTDSTTQLKLTAGAATRTPLAIKAAVAQSANLQEWQNSSDVALAAIKANGTMLLPNPGYGVANAFITLANGSQISSNGDGRFFFGGSGTDSLFLLGVPDQALTVGSSVHLGWTASSTAAAAMDIGLQRSSAGIVKITNGSSGGGSLHFQEQTAPSAPAANNVYLYADDSGGGKTRIMARFATGAAVQIAIEP